MIHFQAARSRTQPESRQVKPLSSATFRVGAPLARDGTDPDQFAEHAGGATVTGIVGVAMAPVTSGVPAYSDHTYDAVGTIPMYVAADRSIEFLGQLINAGSIVVPVKATHEGVAYGMIKVSNEWYVDVADTTNVVLRVTQVFPEINCVLFKWISTAVAD